VPDNDLIRINGGITRLEEINEAISRSGEFSKYIEGSLKGETLNAIATKQEARDALIEEEYGPDIDLWMREALEAVQPQALPDEYGENLDPWHLQAIREQQMQDTPQRPGDPVFTPEELENFYPRLDEYFNQYSNPDDPNRTSPAQPTYPEPITSGTVYLGGPPMPDVENDIENALFHGFDETTQEADNPGNTGTESIDPGNIVDNDAASAQFHGFDDSTRGADNPGSAGTESEHNPRGVVDNDTQAATAWAACAILSNATIWAWPWNLTMPRTAWRPTGTPCCPAAPRTWPGWPPAAWTCTMP